MAANESFVSSDLLLQNILTTSNHILCQETPPWKILSQF